ncbi:uncharacterized protein RAG0_07047 [Rhynchosporium agropyri]|uniref:Uncharacterized protein n=3 Tax=Rhynchosporium TaxID=38037 RepID=A0A1E1MPI3_RHYSE|nr:uncharacterized protein RAG0_07047 [Rhynchosporium agropyri]CZT04961.1 uncharacterized protein RCO7_09166 [Rhynchosporium commune]CZT51002.1 uncharacterized protein RSE6_12084 [Rhynchosporium secalis]
MRVANGQKAAAWPTKRTQRCFSIALIFTLFLIVGIHERQSWPRKAELRVNTRRGLSIYGSSPEAGMPSLPYVEDNKARRSSEKPPF